MGTLIKNAKIVNEGNIIEGDLLIEKELISKVAKNIDSKTTILLMPMNVI